MEQLIHKTLWEIKMQKRKQGSGEDETRCSQRGLHPQQKKPGRIANWDVYLQ
jgi:hypothetical protein